MLRKNFNQQNSEAAEWLKTDTKWMYQQHN